MPTVSEWSVSTVCVEETVRDPTMSSAVRVRPAAAEGTDEPVA